MFYRLAWLALVVPALFAVPALAQLNAADREPATAGTVVLTEEEAVEKPVLLIKSVQTEEPALLIEPVQTEEPALLIESVQTEEPALLFESVQTEEPVPLIESAQTEEPAPLILSAQTEEIAPLIEAAPVDEIAPLTEAAPVQGAAPLALPAPQPMTVAPQDDIFTVRDVSVDAGAETTAIARETAFADGQRTALLRLVARLAVERGQLDVEDMTDEEITGLIRSFQVNSERTTPGRYVANLTFSFEPAAVRGLLRTRLVDFTETVSKPVLVVPVYRSAEGTRLWDAPNPWLDAWLDFFDTERLVPVVVPFGDLADVTDISLDEALAGDLASLRAITTRYDAGDAIVAIAEPQGGALVISLKRFGESTGQDATQFVVPGAESLESMLAAAVEQTTDKIETEWRARTRVQAAERNSLAVLVPVSAPADWFQTQARLARVPTITATRIISLSPTEAVLEFEFIGSEGQLAIALAQQNLALDDELGGRRLRRTDVIR